MQNLFIPPIKQGRCCECEKWCYADDGAMFALHLNRYRTDCDLPCLSSIKWTCIDCIKEYNEMIEKEDKNITKIDNLILHYLSENDINTNDVDNDECYSVMGYSNIKCKICNIRYADDEHRYIASRIKKDKCECNYYHNYKCNNHNYTCRSCFVRIQDLKEKNNLHA